MKTSFTFLVLFLTLGTVNAQDSCAHRCGSNLPYNAGGFGHFYTGPSYFQYGEVSSYLEKPAVLNASLPVRIGTIAGGEGTALLGNFLIGGGGFGQNVVRTTTDSARVDVSIGGGYFKFGYICWYKNQSFGYVYGGIGWGGLNVHLENLTDETPIAFNRRNPLQPGFKADYNLAFNIYDFGISYKKLFAGHDAKDESGGFMLGFDAGCMIMAPTSEWNNNKDDVISGPPVPTAFLNPYLRITIGGGGFGVK
jgi:hypothetical protein